MGRLPDSDESTVTLLEASPRLGGPLRSEDFRGRVVDMGPDGFLGRRPEAVDLFREAGWATHWCPSRPGARVGLGTRATPHAARGARTRDPDQVLADRPLGHRGHSAARSASPATPCCPGPTRVDRSAIVPSAPSWRTNWDGTSSTHWWTR